ncbi:pyridoxamine 5'-phosphate oxidase family protein [Ferrimonas pelagia]|uniref:Pyridoxamine 5'-phosphate oxidase N-terminal domain-containing protein n=1 Tax=Ferrimonas pelagia TaxID=1177826 RepID=A0ABP9EX66_9GAMM
MSDAANTILEFIQSTDVQYLATIGLDGRPKLRPVQMVYAEGGVPVYCTGTGKAMYQELMANPEIELCVCQQHRWVRLSGRVRWLEDRQVKQNIIERNALVASIYHSADNPLLAAFGFERAEATLVDLTDSVARRAPEVVQLC